MTTQHKLILDAMTAEQKLYHFANESPCDVIEYWIQCINLAGKIPEKDMVSYIIRNVVKRGWEIEILNSIALLKK